MILVNIPEYECKTESDVEQKFIYPLLTHPSYLNIQSNSIITKRSLGSLSFVAKTSLPRNYVPDYLVIFHGLPICVIEAKSPSVPTAQALSEARMYGQVINQQFPAGVNPVQFAVGCNGITVEASAIDTNDCETFEVNQLLIGFDHLKDLQRLISRDRLEEVAKKIRSSLGARYLFKPSRLMDAQLLLERIKPNVLAPYLSPVYEMFFRAEDPERTQLIIEQAYVDTAQLREYENVLHSMLRQIEQSSPGAYRPIRTDESREYTLTPELDRYESDIKNSGRLHLVIGSRGAGKSLFISRFFSHLLPPSLKQKSAWCVIDFNKAPSSISNTEQYICEKFVDQINNLQFDPYSLEGLKRIFSVEINRFQRGPLAAIEDEQEKQKLLYRELMTLNSDRVKFALCLARHITGDSNRPLIVAFDNVDRRESGQQLQIFQAAQWFRNETRSFALLTLRDVTFERFKNQPPLDAFAQISNFYIRPPRFALVLQKRLRLAIEIGLNEIAEIEQLSDSGIRFRYTKAQLGQFLQTVYDSMFSGDQEVGKIVDALAERDVREALGMFTRMLSSGHFDPDRLIKIGVGAKADITHDLLIKILMRADYKLFSETGGFIKSIFGLSGQSFKGNAFILVEILGFFVEQRQEYGESAYGYRRQDELVADLGTMGFDEEEVRDGVKLLIGAKMLSYDGEETESPRDDDLIKISPSGFIHLRTLPFFIEYLSSVAIHVPFTEQSPARRIASIWNRTTMFKDLTFSCKHQVASIFADYLVKEKKRLDLENPLFKERARESNVVINAVNHAVNATAEAAARQRGRMRRAGGKSGGSVDKFRAKSEKRNARRRQPSKRSFVAK